MKLPEALLQYVNLEVDLHLEHSGYNLEITGTGHEYTVRFPSLLSAFHYAAAFWPLRKHLPAGSIIHLKYRSFRWKFAR